MSVAIDRMANVLKLDGVVGTIASKDVLATAGCTCCSMPARSTRWSSTST